MLISPTRRRGGETSGAALGYNGFYFDLWAKGVNEELCCRLRCLLALLHNCASNKLLQGSVTVMNYPVDSFYPSIYCLYFITAVLRFIALASWYRIIDNFGFPAKECSRR